MTDTDTVMPEFNRTVRGYDRLQVDNYIESLKTALHDAEQRALKAEGKDLAGAPSRARRLHPVPSIEDESHVPSFPTEDAATTARKTALRRQSALEELTRERDRLMSEIGALERRRATILGASLADGARA